MKKRKIIILLIIAMLHMAFPLHVLANGSDEPNVSTESTTSADLPKYWDYTLFSGSASQPLTIHSSKSNVTGDIFANHDFTHLGSSLQVEGAIEAVGKINVQGKMEVWFTEEEASPVDMPQFGSIIRGMAGLHAERFVENKQYNGNILTINQSLIVDGHLTFEGSKMVVQDYIVASGDITLNVSSVASADNKRLLLYSEHGDITIGASQTDIDGILYAPNGTVRINGSSFNLSGRIIAQEIVMNGSSFELHGNEDDLEFLTGYTAVLGCIDELQAIYSELPFNDYTTPYNSPDVGEVQFLLLDVSAALHEDNVQALRLCQQAKNKLQALDEQLQEEQQLLEAIAADPLGDYDGDGLLNGFELEMLSHSTSPLLSDTDGDGIPDGDEDPDRDDLTNVQEQALGMDP